MPHSCIALLFEGGSENARTKKYFNPNEFGKYFSCSNVEMHTHT